MKIKAETSKRFQLSLAIKHYLRLTRIYRFVSLYDDFEPFPLKEVIFLLERRISELKAEYALCASQFLKGEIAKNEKNLKKLNERLKERGVYA